MISIKNGFNPGGEQSPLSILGKKKAIIFTLVISLILACNVIFFWSTSSSLEVSYSQEVRAIPTPDHVKSNATSFKPAVFKTNFHDDFLWFNGKKAFPIMCDSCALVNSAGTILNSTAGKEIDGHDCVIRMNNAPTANYELDVGTKTTYRIFSHSSVIDVKNYAQITPKEVESTLFLVWGPKRNLEPGRITNTHLKDIVRRNPNISIHVLSQERVQEADNRFEVETGKNRLKSGSYLSTGWFTILFTKDVCKKINIYGMVEDDYCDKIHTKLLRDVPYHYYTKGPSQCSTYVAHERSKAGAHRFITEKRVFKKWAKSWGNIYFHHPEWDLK